MSVDQDNAQPPSATALFALVVVAATFVEAVLRLGTRALETCAIESGMTHGHWLALAAAIVCFGYFEGYRSLHKRFVPGVLSRARRCSRPPDTASLWAKPLFAPLSLLALVNADRRSVVRAWASVALIVAAVIAVRQLPFPWRGIVDAGVATALSMGLASLVTGTARWVSTSRSQSQPRADLSPLSRPLPATAAQPTHSGLARSRRIS